MLGSTGAQAKERIYLEYICSKCGVKNTHKQWIVAESNDITKEASTANSVQRLRETLEQLKSLKPSRRYENAGLNCVCQKCGHREPWARMRFSWFGIFRYLCVPVCTVLLFVGIMNDRPWQMLLETAMAVVLASVAFCGKTVWKRLMGKKIETLPLTAFPKIYIGNSTQGTRVRPPASIEEGYWGCYECGRVNSDKRSRCVYCGTAQDWSREKVKLHPFVFEPEEETKTEAPKKWPVDSSKKRERTDCRIVRSSVLQGSPWTQVQCLLAMPYGYGQMLDIMQILSDQSIVTDRVWKADLANLPPVDVTAAFQEADAIRNCAALAAETGMLSIAGMFQMDVPRLVKIDIFNQTPIIHLHVLESHQTPVNAEAVQDFLEEVLDQAHKLGQLQS